MDVTIKKNATTVEIGINEPRIDGMNHILAAIQSGNFLNPTVRQVDLDFHAVEYLNSLGITEIINIHRSFTDVTGGNVRFRFINVDFKVRSILELVEIQKIAEIIPKKV